MASKMFENLNAIVANTLTDSIKMVDIDELHESSDNFFNVNRIEEFAETILGQGGVKDNLVVRPLGTGGYEIISGHRRTAAVRYLLEHDENISRYLPCLVQNYDDEDDKRLDLVLFNITARQICDAEMWKSYEIVDEILQKKKSAGEKFGRIRDKLADILGISSAQVQKMQNIDKNAIPHIKEAVKSCDMSISTANEVANLGKGKQEELLQATDVSDVKHKDVKKLRETGTPESPPAESRDENCDTYITNPETVCLDGDDKTSVLPKSEKCDTYITKSETTEESDASSDEVDEDETNEDEADSYSQLSITEYNDSDTNFTEKAKVETLESFIHKNYHDLDSIFTTYISMTDDSGEADMLEKFKDLLYKVKEAERNKVRFGV